MGYTPHISIKGDFSQSSVVCDVFAWCQKMGKTGIKMEQQVVNIDEINSTLKWQMGFSEKRKSSLKSTLELMTWIRERYAKALAELQRKATTGDTGGKSKKEMEDAVLDLQENEKKVGELISEIRTKLKLPEDKSTTSESALRQIRQQAAQLSEIVADVEEKSNPMRQASRLPTAQELKLQHQQQAPAAAARLQDLADHV